MPSFDAVSEVNLQEVKNAVDQVMREIGTRFDFRGSNANVELLEKELQLVISVEDAGKLESVQELLRQKLAKRGVSLKCVEFGEPAPAGGNTLRQVVTIKQGLSDEQLKRLNKLIKDQKLKITSQIQGKQLRVSGKQRDDLQKAIAMFRAQASDLELQFVNFRD